MKDNYIYYFSCSHNYI